MKVKIRKMSENDAFKILFWQYAPPYDWYNLDGCEECLGEFLYDEYYSAIDDKEQLVGFFCFGRSAQISVGKQLGFYDDSDYLDIGLGMHPLLCGKGNGAKFLSIGMRYAQRTFQVKKFRLTVAEFNHRGIKAYQKAGFYEVGSFVTENKVEKIKFKVMIYDR